MRADEVPIAGWKTGKDWHKFRASLIVGGDEAKWREAFNEYFRTRLDLRYLHPIKILEEQKEFRGEGFSILTIQCSLLEFLESTVQGINYRYPRKGEKPGKYEYSSSRQLFVCFLCNRYPFSRYFDEALGNSFYAGVRCGLFHEARLNGGWILAPSTRKGSLIIDRERLIVYRVNFQVALNQFISWYEKALQSDSDLQAGFIRKFDSLCQ